MAHLRREGMRVLATDWRCRLGQIDIVAEENGTVVLVEVKARRGATFGTAAEAVDARKQHKLRSLLDAYRSATHRLQQPCRIDVVALRLDANLRVASCEHIRDAVRD